MKKALVGKVKELVGRAGTPVVKTLAKTALAAVNALDHVDAEIGRRVEGARARRGPGNVAPEPVPPSPEVEAVRPSASKETTPKGPPSPRTSAPGHRAAVRKRGAPGKAPPDARVSPDHALPSVKRGQKHGHHR